jgi:hypothetical protein
MHDAILNNLRARPASFIDLRAFAVDEARNEEESLLHPDNRAEFMRTMEVKESRMQIG